MNAKTLKALKGSIAKWQAIVNGDGVDSGPGNCSLCMLFYGDDWVGKESDCDGCPIRQKTKQQYCKSTPYVDWKAITKTNGMGRKADTIERVNAARAELRFLKSLLPRKRK